MARTTASLLLVSAFAVMSGPGNAHGLDCGEKRLLQNISVIFGMFHQPDRAPSYGPCGFAGMGKKNRIFEIPRSERSTMHDCSVKSHKTY